MKKSGWKIANSVFREKFMDFNYRISRSDEGKKFMAFVGNRKVFSTIKFDMIGFRVGQFFLTKKIGSGIHIKKTKGKRRR